MSVFDILFAVFCVVGFIIGAFVWFFRTLAASWHDWSWRKRICFFGMGIAMIASPYLAYKGVELRFVLARVPPPLHTSWIEYRVEKAWGIGLPGDNETGFVVYRLTEGSTRWAKSKGGSLGQFLPGGTDNWRATPVDEWEDGGQQWHLDGSQRGMMSRQVDIKGYLDKYGFGIEVEQRHADSLNRALRQSGSFYSYGPGGSITVVDPQQGKIYFAYSG